MVSYLLGVLTGATIVVAWALLAGGRRKRAQARQMTATAAPAYSQATQSSTPDMALGCDPGATLEATARRSPAVPVAPPAHQPERRAHNRFNPNALECF